MGRKKKSKSTALVLYRPPLPAVVPAEDPGEPSSPASDNLVAEWGRDLLKSIEEIAPDCRVHPEVRSAGRWR
jgi:hypothetical protein